MRLTFATMVSCLVLGAGITACQAAVVPIGAVTAGNTYGGTTTNMTTGVTHIFDDGFSFTSASSFKIDLSILTSLSQPSTISSIAYNFYSGTFGTGTLISPIGVTPTTTKSAVGTYTSGSLGPGSYYFEMNGTTSKTSSVTDQATFSVSAVPLPGALPMFGAALLALGGVAFLRNRKAADQGLSKAVVA